MLKTATDITNHSSCSLENIKLALHKLDKPDWYTHLEYLSKSFNGLDTQLSFEEECVNILWFLINSKAIDQDLPISQMFAIQLSKIEIWEYRAINTANDSTHHFFNALETLYSSFKNDSTMITQTAGSYPSQDIIKRWSIDRLK